MVDLIVCLKKCFSFFFFFFMLIMFDFNRIVKIYCEKFFHKHKKIHKNKNGIHKNKNEIHKNKNEIHKSRTLGKKPGQIPDNSLMWTSYCYFT